MSDVLLICLINLNQFGEPQFKCSLPDEDEEVAHKNGASAYHKQKQKYLLKCIDLADVDC